MKHIYLDHNATSPASEEHLSRLFLKLKDNIANPSSPHAKGRSASVCLTEARRAVAKSLQVDVAEIIFLSGATEANNLATVGVLRQNNRPLTAQRVITSAFEHPAVREPLEYLKYNEGLHLTELSVKESGYFSIKELLQNITPETTLISLMAANNEIGTLQPVKLIGDYLHYLRWGVVNSHTEKEFFDELSLAYLNANMTKELLQKIHFHVDAVQCYGKLELTDWFSPGIDSCAISGHKIGSLQGVGALFLRRGRKYLPFILGGAQEKNRRAGTENLPGIISFGMVANELYTTEWQEQKKHVIELRNFLLRELSAIPCIVLNTPATTILPNTVHFSLNGKGFKGEDLLVELDIQGICASSGSACSSGANLPSKVVLALGKTPELAKNSIRLSLSHSNSLEEIKYTISIIKKYLNI